MSNLWEELCCVEELRKDEMLVESIKELRGSWKFSRGKF